VRGILCCEACDIAKSIEIRTWVLVFGTSLPEATKLIWPVQRITQRGIMTEHEKVGRKVFVSGLPEDAKKDEVR